MKPIPQPASMEPVPGSALVESVPRPASIEPVPGSAPMKLTSDHTLVDLALVLPSAPTTGSSHAPGGPSLAISLSLAPGGPPPAIDLGPSSETPASTTKPGLQPRQVPGPIVYSKVELQELLMICMGA